MPLLAKPRWYLTFEKEAGLKKGTLAALKIRTLDWLARRGEANITYMTKEEEISSFSEALGGLLKNNIRCCWISNAPRNGVTVEISLRAVPNKKITGTRLVMDARPLRFPDSFLVMTAARQVAHRLLHPGQINKLGLPRVLEMAVYMEMGLMNFPHLQKKCSWCEVGQDCHVRSRCPHNPRPVFL